VRAILVDRRPSVNLDTRAAFHRLGWDVEPVAADVLAWLGRPQPDISHITLANLFLHHFDEGRLVELLAAVSKQTRRFVACEPHRSRAALIGASLLGAIGCNDVTRHDACISVLADSATASCRRHGRTILTGSSRNGEPGRSRRPSWPTMWRDAVIIGGGPAGTAAAILLAKAGWSVSVVEMSPFPRRKVCGEFLSATNLPLLRDLGVADAFACLAGPPVTRVGIFAGAHQVVAHMPRLDSDADGWGRALGREHLDALLLDRAAAAGATVWQPYTAAQITGRPGDFSCTITSRAGGGCPDMHSLSLRTPVLIAAHGSWHSGGLPTQPHRATARARTCSGSRRASLRAAGRWTDAAPRLFPVGMEEWCTPIEHVSFSCCVRRDQLERCRATYPGASAGAAVLMHVIRHCAGVPRHASSRRNSSPAAGAPLVHPAGNSRRLRSFRNVSDW
jgi:hypothetical protein